VWLLTYSVTVAERKHTVTSWWVELQETSHRSESNVKNTSELPEGVPAVSGLVDFVVNTPSAQPRTTHECELFPLVASSNFLRTLLLCNCSLAF
jgi:hypothetical protein